MGNSNKYPEDFVTRLKALIPQKSHDTLENYLTIKGDDKFIGALLSCQKAKLDKKLSYEENIARNEFNKNIDSLIKEWKKYKRNPASKIETAASTTTVKENAVEAFVEV